MVNPAIVAGLLAGYTVGAVVTAIAAAKELSSETPSGEARLLNARPPHAVGPCVDAGSPTRRARRCLQLGHRSARVTVLGASNRR